jgi:hypothetical protein
MRNTAETEAGKTATDTASSDNTAIVVGRNSKIEAEAGKIEITDTAEYLRRKRAVCSVKESVFTIRETVITEMTAI